MHGPINIKYTDKRIELNRITIEPWKYGGVRTLDWWLTGEHLLSHSFHETLTVNLETGCLHYEGLKITGYVRSSTLDLRQQLLRASQSFRDCITKRNS